VREFADLTFKHLGMPLEWQGAEESEIGVDADGKVRVRVDPQYYRPAEVELLIGDYRKAREQLGWQPQTTFAKLVAIMADADLELVKKEGR
jgi:GDPmannose 4,6-dehydratase